MAAALLSAGDVASLETLGVVHAREALARISEVLPLVAVGTSDSFRAEFRVHDLVDGFLLEHAVPDVDLMMSCIGLLTDREAYGRAIQLLMRLTDPTLALAWLTANGTAAYAVGEITSLRELIEAVPVPRLMSDARLLVLWSRICYETGSYEEALTKAKAAQFLAEHGGDEEALRGSIRQHIIALHMLGRDHEAIDIAESVVRSNKEYVDDALLAEALFLIGVGRVMHGDMEGARVPLTTVLELARQVPDSIEMTCRVTSTLALTHVLELGDYETARRMLAPLASEDRGGPTASVMIRGNLAICLAESGRVERAEALARQALKDVESFGLDTYAGAYLPILGLAQAGLGDLAEATVSITRGIDASTRMRDHGDAAASRVHLALVLRANGELERSLTAAEQAHEMLESSDWLGFRRMAALEVGASLLSLRDVTAARAWVVGRGAGAARDSSGQHLLRAALVLAECDRREGDLHAAIERLLPHTDYIRSENANLLLALYCRAFPALLGVVCNAVGVATLPSHMLRMIPPESAEQILVATHDWLEHSMWRELGVRLLGEEEHAKFIARDGLPVCHVHFFGGLEVSIGGRSIREKDWRKRKARLLCAMLVLRRGQDVPREQIYEYLFPEMDPERAKNNLYVVWSTMKSVLMGDDGKGSPLPYFEAVGGVCRAVRANIRSDVDDFDKLLESATGHEQAGELADALRAYERLSSLYRGELLPGDVYDDWFSELRDHYRITFVNAMLAAGAILMEADDPGNALVYVRRAIQTDPLREDLYQVALRCQIAGGQRSGAIDTYLQCRAKLADDLGLDPSAETKALYDQILAMEDKPRIIPLEPLVD
jgi:DNA-binding SARP family transcriptional activator/Flp pilus assembly protein TadD